MSIVERFVTDPRFVSLQLREGDCFGPRGFEAVFQCADGNRCTIRRPTAEEVCTAAMANVYAENRIAETGGAS